MSFDPKALGAAGAALLAALAQTIAPPLDQTPWEWAEGRLVVPAEANTSRPGPMSFDGVEYTLEPIERLHYDDPCSRVSIKAAAQTAKSNTGVVWVGWTVCEAPRPMGLAVPSGPKAQSFNSKKLQPVIDKTPDLAARIIPASSRDERASTTRQKNYPGGSLTIFSAGSVNDLQSESFGAVWITESPNFLADIAGRGSPIGQVRSRMDGWEARGTKELHESTPGEEGACPITADYEAGDQRQLYFPCPQCDQAFRIDWAGDETEKDRPKHGFVVPADPADDPYVATPCCGYKLEEWELPLLKKLIRARLVAERRFREAGEPIPADLEAGYLPTFPSKDPANPPPGDSVAKADFAKWRSRPTEGREPSFYFWQVVSPFKTWRGVAKDWRDARGKPSEEAAFRQQKLALATEAAVKAPGKETLLLAAQKLHVQRARIPPGTCWLAGAADIQGDRIEWAAYAVGPTFRARIDRGVIEHDPLEAQAWAELAKVLTRRYDGPECREIGFDVFGIDSGGKDGVTPQVYTFVRGKPNVYAVKGANKALPGLLPTDLRKHKGKDVKGRKVVVELLLVDGYMVKRYVAYGLQNLVKSADLGVVQPGTILFEDDVTEQDFEQLTAERFVRAVGARQGERGTWEQTGPNEQLDLAYYAWGLAYQKRLHTWDAARWELLFAARARTEDAPEPPLLALATAPAVEIPNVELPPNPGTGRVWFRKKG